MVEIVERIREKILPRGILKLLTFLGLAAVGYWAVFFSLVLRSPLTYRELDFNRDGNVSFGEAEYASSYGTRSVKVEGKECVEYFALKDGLP